MRRSASLYLMTEQSDRVDVPDAPAEKGSCLRFGIRSVLAATACIALLAGAIRWLLQMGVPVVGVVIYISPWAIGSFAGMLLMRRQHRNQVLGAVLGGSIGVVGMFLMGELRVVQFLVLLTTAACGSTILAALFGIVMDGVTLRRPPD